jgi:hypothetical protein
VPSGLTPLLVWANANAAWVATSFIGSLNTTYTRELGETPDAPALGENASITGSTVVVNDHDLAAARGDPTGPAPPSRPTPRT